MGMTTSGLHTIQASRKTNAVSVAAFPNVCVVARPPGGAPAPIPYPSVGTNSHVAAAEQGKVTGTITVKTYSRGSAGDEPGVLGGVVSATGTGGLASHSFFDRTVTGKSAARAFDVAGPRPSPRATQLRARLQTINTQLVGLTAGNPDHWHELVDEYVVVAAELYLELSK